MSLYLTLPVPQRVNAYGLSIIMHDEGLRLLAYLDENNVPTIGWGHTHGVHLGMTCTRAEAVAWLGGDTHFAELSVSHYVKVPLTSNQFSALVSFVFNEGSGHFDNSTLLRLLNLGAFEKAADQFLRWEIVHGKHSDGLQKRREVERQLFLTPDGEPFVPMHPLTKRV